MRRSKATQHWLATQKFRLVGVGLVLLVFFIYLPGLRGPFVFDDLTNIALVEQIRIKSLDYESLHNSAFWQKADVGSGRPVAMLSFALNYYLSEFDAFGFKLTNLLIHIANAVLLWCLTFRILRRLKTTYPKIGHPRNLYWLSLLVAGLWAIHPLNLTSVLYVVQRMTSLASLFMLLGLLSYTIGRDQLAAGRKIGLPIAVGGIAFFGVMATMTKEIALLLPLYALVIEATCYRVGAREPLKKWVRGFWGGLIGIACVVAVLKYDLLVRLFVTGYDHREFTPVERLLTETRVIWFYIKLIFLPAVSDFGIYHDDIILSRGLFEPTTTFFSVIGILGLAGIATASHRRAPIVAFGIGWFLAGHLLESTLLPLELVHEHRNYLPQFGLLFILAWYTLAPSPTVARTIRLRQTFAALCLLLFSSVTLSRSLDWKDEWTLYNREAANHPNSSGARTMLAVILHDNRLDDLAAEQFKAAAVLNTADSRTMLRLVQHTYVTKGHVPEPMLQELERRVSENRYSNTTLWTFEPLLRQTTKSRALNLRLIRLFESLIQRPDNSLTAGWRERAFQTMGFAHRETGNYPDSLAYFLRAAKISATSTNHLLAASIHVKLGQYTEAEEIVSTVRPNRDSLDPDNQARLSELESSLAYRANIAKPARPK